jgi:DNA-binding PadR family transcriptional regulator
VPGERGPGRRSYALTASGRAQLADEREGWGRLVAALDPEPCHEGVVAG